jgi:hypothetical protein
MPAENFAGLAGGQEDDASDALNQNLLANDDMATGEMATGEDFQFFPPSQTAGSAICPIIGYEHAEC